MRRVLILANSIKKSARCVAGREINKDAGTNRIGDWIRPVSNLSEGELLGQHYALSGGGAARVLDIVDMPLASRKDDPGQPENWLLAEGIQWTKVESLPASELALVRETPPDLWMERTDHSDRISIDAQSSRNPQSSLAVISPSGFHVRLWREFNPWKNYTQRKTRAVFTFAGHEYSLWVTDPLFSRDHCSNHPAENEGVRKVVPPCGDNCLLCISLTPPWIGYHYKVVATVLSLP